MNILRKYYYFIKIYFLKLEFIFFKFLIFTIFLLINIIYLKLNIKNKSILEYFVNINKFLNLA